MVDHSQLTGEALHAPAPHTHADPPASWVDRYLGRFVSKKLLVFVAATLLLWIGKLTPEWWAHVASIYVGGQAIVDAAAAFKHGRRL